jgi:acetyl-CoA carboxylase biotin carboxyl carrier protein
MSEKNGNDLKKVKELIELMKENDLCEIELVDGENKILLKRPQAQMQAVGQMPVPQMMAPAAAAAPAAAPAPVESNLIDIKSPMVGTFYGSPSPDSDPFVKVGDAVGPETVVCIIEAMKVMNEISAEASGTVVEIVCQTGQAAEFGEVLFKVRPN